MTAALALLAREWKRFARQPSRVVASIGAPLMIWVFAGAGFAGSMRSGVAEASSGDLAYAAYLLPGIVTMTILFSTIFAAISLIQDRHAGFLQSALVSPAPAWAVVFAKAFGGAAIATCQSAILLLGAYAVGLSPGPLDFLGALAAAALTAIAVIGLGLSAAWWVDSTAGFHGVMNMLLMPMWLLSGALFPVEGAAPWLAALVRFNPLHWSTRAIAHSLGVGEIGNSVWAWVGTITFAAAMFALAAIIMSRRSRRLGVSGQSQD